MEIKKIFLKLALLSLIFNLNFGFAAWAQELSVSPTPTDTQELIPTEEPTPSPDATTTSEPTPTMSDVAAATVTEDNITPTLTPTGTNNEGEISPTPTDTENINEADVNNETINQSSTGNNESITGDNVQIVTGDAAAWANLINIINSNFDGSNYRYFFLNNFSGNYQDIDMNKVWGEIGGNQVAEDEKNLLLISNKNVANLSNKVTVVADSGNNLAESIEGSALVISGNAIAIANVINIVNANFSGSDFFIGIVNISSALAGDLILPRPENFGSQNNNNESGGSSGQNQGQINDTVMSQATTGGNESTGSGKMVLESGDALSRTNTLTYSNISGDASGQMIGGVNVVGNWSGKIYNWSAPGAVDTPSSNFFTFIVNGSGGGGAGNENSANINNFIMVKANTGLNQISSGGDAELRSGNAIAMANLVNLVNWNLNGSNWFFGLINIVGNWSGNIIFAYPDLVSSISKIEDRVTEGEEINFDVGYGNEGYDGVDMAAIEVEYDPNVLTYIDDDSSLEKTVDSGRIRWKISGLNMKSKEAFRIKFVTNSSIASSRTGFSLVKRVWAAENFERETELKVVISGDETESNPFNNSSSVMALVITKANNNENNNDDDQDRLFKLEIGARNNVGDYVYPEDIVTFEVEAKNLGEGDAKDAYFKHEVVTPSGEIWRSVELDIGNIKTGRSGKVNFGIPLTRIAEGGVYKSRTVLVAFSNKGTRVESNVAETSFLVNLRNTLLVNNPVGQVEAASPGIEENTLGVFSDISEENLLIYLVLFLTSSAWLLRFTKRKLEAIN